MFQRLIVLGFIFLAQTVTHAAAPKLDATLVTEYRDKVGFFKIDHNAKTQKLQITHDTNQQNASGLTTKIYCSPETALFNKSEEIKTHLQDDLKINDIKDVFEMEKNIYLVIQQGYESRVERYSIYYSPEGGKDMILDLKPRVRLIVQ